MTGSAVTFETLTYEQQLDRLTHAARQTLSQYGLQESQLENLSYYNNAVYKVTAPDGNRFTLRLHRPGHKRIEWIHAELYWLAHLRQNTALLIPRPALTITGALLAEAPVEDIPQPLPCALFHWLDGHFYGTSDMDSAPIYQAGVFLAQLHQAASVFPAPSDFLRPRLDWGGLFGEESPYNPGEGAKIFTHEQKAIFVGVEEQVRETMMAVGQSSNTFGMIHADFLSKNIVFNQQAAGAIDFDECGWGYYLYDLAPLLLQFKSDGRYELLRDAFLDGYSSLRPLSSTDTGHLELFIAARHLASCRWQAGNLHNPHIRQHAAKIIARRTEDLRRFLKTGILEIER
jgi:Ser/Thr protein kinase RdoA (MazF antagonist)